MYKKIFLGGGKLRNVSRAHQWEKRNPFIGCRRGYYRETIDRRKILPFEFKRGEVNQSQLLEAVVSQEKIRAVQC